MFERRICVGNIPENKMGYKRGVKAYLNVAIKTRPATKTIDLEPCENLLELTISGECDDSWGQNIETFVTLFPQNRALQRLCEIWHRWHLNTLCPGTRAQQNFVRCEIKDYDYEAVCKRLQRVGLYEDRGYKYGYAWLAEILPQSIIEEVKQLCEEIDVNS